MFALKYAPDSPLGARFPSFVLNTFRTLEAAEAVRHECANASSIEIVEVGLSAVREGGSGSECETMEAQQIGPDNGVCTSGRGLIDADRSAN